MVDALKNKAGRPIKKNAQFLAKIERFIVKFRQVIGIPIYLVLINTTLIPPKDR